MNLTLISIVAALVNPVLGLLSGKQATTFSSDLNDAPVFTLVHAINGRRRYRSVLLKDQNFAENIKKRLTALPGIDSVTVNYVTCSILITYSTTDQFIDSIFSEINQASQNADKKNCEEESNCNCKHHCHKVPSSTLRRKINVFIDNVDLRLKNASKGKVDLGILVGLVCLIQGIRQIIRLKEYPSGPQFVWWGFHLLRSWR